MNNYFNTQIYNPDYQESDINTLIEENMSLVVGDFWGIQSFLFDGLTTVTAAKVLRSKSAFIQVFTEVLAKYICKKLSIDEKYIISINAGKFEILVPFQNADINEIQKKVDTYFIEKFYALSGVILCSINVSRSQWRNNYKSFRDDVAKEIEKSKFNKFDLIHTNPILEYDTGITNQNLCKVCNLRRRKKECDYCHQCEIFVEFGKILTQKDISMSSDKLGIIFEDFKTTIEVDERLKSYIPKEEENDNPLPFESIAEKSCKNSDLGIKALGILKADVDSMGNFIEESDVTDSFTNFDKFSKGLDNFFSIYIPRLLRKKYQNIYTVFSGGDDLFLVGAWDEIMEFSRDIQKQFKEFVYSEKTKLSISFGIAIAKPSTPISYLAKYTDELLNDSKEIDDEKDALTIWGESVKWADYIQVHTKLSKTFTDYQNLKTTTIYRFLEFCDMRKHINKDIKNALWKSKLNYLFSRNMDMSKDSLLMKILNENIEEHPSETKIFLCEFIYKQREH